jgi:hypothetical protein
MFTQQEKPEGLGEILARAIQESTRFGAMSENTQSIYCAL